MSESKLSTFSESLFWKDFNIHQENMFDLSKTEFINYHTLAWQLGTLSEQQKGYEYFQKLPQWPPAISTAAEGLVFQKACYQIKNNREKKKKNSHPNQTDTINKDSTYCTFSQDNQLYFLSKSTKNQQRPDTPQKQIPAGRFWQSLEPGFFLHCK